MSIADLVLESLSKGFDGPTGTVQVLSDVELTLRRGDAVAVTGPSGSGKSTLLYIIGGLDRPSTGRCLVLGKTLAELSSSDCASFRSQHIGFIFQDHHLLPQLTVLENVLVPLLASAGVSAADELRARGLLERVGLAHRVDHRPAQLSGGERQRVAVCRALINQPSILLADEPTGSLDRSSAQAVGSLLLDLCREQQTLLICVTHSKELAAQFPKQLELLDGRLVAVEQR
jgi:lipoprotein-releasing system ATP-binding protein